MRRWIVGTVIAVPLVVLGLYWLMLHGYLELTAWLLLIAVLTLVGLALWRWRKGQPGLAAMFLAVALLTGATIGWYGWTLNSKLDNIARAKDDVLDHGKRPDKRDTEALNILLMGADNPQQLVKKPTIAELLAKDTWNPGAYRSDTMMIVHIPADRKSAYIVSVPRDSYVPIYNAEGQREERHKINDAFSSYGPFGTWRTLENLTGLRLDHMAVVDFAGFRDLTTAIGGVDVYVPEDTYDSKQDQEWTKGWHHVEGNLALKYVRQRYGLIGGDFDRADRQQNFLRAVMDKTLADDTIGNPVKFKQTLEALTANLTVDESWSNGQIRGLALSMRSLDSKKVKFVTAPLGSYDDVPGDGSVVRLDPKASKELWQAIDEDRLDDYLKKHPDDELGDPKDVS